MYLRPTAVCFVVTFLHISTTFGERLLPPEIETPQGNQWQQSIVKRATQTLPVVCNAKGNPTPTYIWKKDRKVIQQEQNRVTFDNITGILYLGTDFGNKDNGFYQCIAVNSQGSSMTPFLKIQLARVDQFPGSSDEIEESINEFLYKKISCNNLPISVPDHEFKWVRGEVGDEKAVVPDDRLVLDTKGNLHILWVKKDEDAKLYKCGFRNPIVSVDMWNTMTTRLTVADSNLLDPTRSPTLKFHEDVVVMAGETAVLTCIFSYYTGSNNQSNKLVVTWLKGGVVKQESTSFTYTIENVPYPTATRNDEGQYLCRATLPGFAPVEGFVNLTINAPPQFIKGQALERLAIPKGQDAVFRCKTDSQYARSYSHPPMWYVNSRLIIGCLPSEFQCTQRMENGSTICLPNTTRCNDWNDCPDGSDEDFCPPKSCPEGKVLCNQKCIPSGSACSPIICNFPSFFCKNNESCPPASQKCDGHSDCTDGSDEEFCPSQVEYMVGKYRFATDHSMMTLPNVSLSDNMCVQCMVINEFGTSFGDGCLTVIDQIYVNPRPNATYDVSPGMYLNIGVDATTDSAYASQIDFVWYIHEDVEDEETGKITHVIEKLPNEEFMEYITTSSTEKNLTIAIPGTSGSDEFSDEEEYQTYKRLTYNRLFSLVVEHPYDRVVLNFTLNGEQIAPPVVVPTTAQAGSNLWLIAVILGIIVLIALVIFIICMVCRRDPRGAYYVDKKEHEAGNDPEQELKDSGFHDVGRVEDDDMDDKPEMEKISLSESVNQYESDDDITEEYGGDFDMSSKFNEDGSFIGVYTDKKSKSRGTKEATV